MSKPTDSRLKMFFLFAGVLIFAGALLALVTSKSQPSSGENLSAPEEKSENAPKLFSEKYFHDFGTVSMANGLAKYSFSITNSGAGDLKIEDIKTSCMCTSAVLKIGEKKSPEFGMHSGAAFWSEVVPPGGSAELEITFDPLAHGPEAVGLVKRTITIISNSGGKANASTVFSIAADVVK